MCRTENGGAESKQRLHDGSSCPTRRRCGLDFPRARGLPGRGERHDERCIEEQLLGLQEVLRSHGP